ncbi:DnaJ sub C member 12 [Coemansia nantahalensis]|uniref:DnaJ sub C member 12 n=2 Tax=Coemansia TaxID=4863 RepID=A0ACC1L789_9FUNG|nr:DnaJ sub C member 12 [Coemansia nantahalensis]KAJ2802669.1 DnaJ sub C member 12 [Coemansia helicoidea]
MDEPDYYEVLGCTPQAAAEQIQAEYRVRAQACHPDRAPERRAQWEQTRAAWEVLGDPQLRVQYNRWRATHLPIPFGRWVASHSSAAVHWTGSAPRALPEPAAAASSASSGARPDVYELFRSYKI